MKASFELTPAFVLHYRSFSDNSLIVDFFTVKQGRVTCIAKGVKKGKYRKAAILQPFTPLMMNFSGLGEMKTLREVEAIENTYRFEGKTLYAAYYINELLLKFLQQQEVQQELFSKYAMLLRQFQSAQEIEVLLRGFEVHLLFQMGFALQLTHDALTHSPVDGNKLYVYNLEQGPYELNSPLEINQNNLLIHGESLLALHNEAIEKKLHRQESKKLLRYVIQHHLDGYQFKSRDFFMSKGKSLI